MKTDARYWHGRWEREKLTLLELDRAFTWAIWKAKKERWRWRHFKGKGEGGIKSDLPWENAALLWAPLVMWWSWPGDVEVQPKAAGLIASWRAEWEKIRWHSPASRFPLDLTRVKSQPARYSRLAFHPKFSCVQRQEEAAESPRCVIVSRGPSAAVVDWSQLLPDWPRVTFAMSLATA